MASTFEEIQKQLQLVHQDHILRFWNELSADEQQEFLHQLQSVNIKDVNSLYDRATKSFTECQESLDGKIQPIPPTQFASEENSTEEVLDNYRNRGLQEIVEGKVAVLLLAGGQGTRLGVNYPKGMYSVGLPSGKSLFQIQAERIRRLQNLAEEKTGNPGRIPWFIMTSGPTYGPTIDYLKRHNYFQLKQEDIMIFQQGLLPCFDQNGKLLLQAKNSLALAPDGNGGIYRALLTSGVLDEMKKRAIQYVHVHSVDNILVKVADPVFVGYCSEKRADCCVKVVKKNGPTEAVGVVCQVDGRFRVVEYSEITEETAKKTKENGELMFNAGNMCNHMFTVDFLERITEKYENQMKLHVALKKVPFLNDKGELVKPTKPQAYKIEKFIFDVFEFSERFATWEVPRNSEFSALKNADDAGKDCPATARKDLLALHKKYLENSGAEVLCEEIEISPLLSYDGENLEAFKGKVFDKPQVLENN